MMWKPNRAILLRRLSCVIMGLLVIGGLFYFSGQNPALENGVQVTEKVSDGTYPDAYMVSVKNRFDYQTGLECSAFSSAYVLRHYGEEAGGVELFKTFPNKVYNRGVPPSGIEKFFQARGYEAVFKEDGTIEDLKRLVSKGAPVIVFIHLTEPYTSTHNTHYLPLVGYDKEYLYFAESLSDFANCKAEKDVVYNRKTDIAKFKRLWKNIDGIWDNPYFLIAKKAAL